MIQNNGEYPANINGLDTGIDEPDTQEDIEYQEEQLNLTK